MKLKNISEKLLKIKPFIARYAVIIFIVGVALVFIFLTLRIANYSDIEPTDDQIDERLSTLQTIKLNEEAVQKIQELQDHNINIESLFDNGRDNPFE